MLQQNETVLQQQIARADNETAELKRSLQQITFGGNIEADEESVQSRKELLGELKRQQAANTILRDVCEEAFPQTVYEHTGQKIKSVKATNDSSALAGFINTSGEELRINQDISDVTADSRSFAAAGVIKDVNFSDLRPRNHESENVPRGCRIQTHGYMGANWETPSGCCRGLRHNLGHIGAPSLAKRRVPARLDEQLGSGPVYY